MKLVQTREDRAVRIHNNLAAGRGDFSACMLDILFYILSDFKKEETKYLVRAKDIMEITGREWQYTQFREATEALGSKMFEIETAKTYTQLWLFGSVTYLKGQGSFEVEISKKALPYLEDVKEKFTSMQLKSILMCSSKYAKRLYMLGCQWRGRGKAEMTIGELKIMLGLKDSKGKKPEKYKQFTEFKKYVLDVAKKQINDNTDITIDYEFHKKGRSYHWITILINYQAIAQLEFNFDMRVADQKSVKTIMGYGVQEKDAVPIAKHGIREFEKVTDKINAKIRAGEMEMKGAVPYILTVYRNKGIITD